MFQSAHKIPVKRWLNKDVCESESWRPLEPSASLNGAVTASWTNMIYRWQVSYQFFSSASFVSVFILYIPFLLLAYAYAMLFCILLCAQYVALGFASGGRSYSCSLHQTQFWSLNTRHAIRSYYANKSKCICQYLKKCVVLYWFRRVL